MMNTPDFTIPFPAGGKAPASERLQLLERLDSPVQLPVSPGWDFSLPIRLAPGSRGSLKRLRLRTLGDELADAVSQKPRPTTRAIRMANALMLERILGSGQFRSPAALASRLGISRSVISDLLAMLNLPPSEIEHVLFETC